MSRRIFRPAEELRDMRSDVVAVLLVVIVALGAGAGYLIGASNRQTTTSVSTAVSASTTTKTETTTVISTNTTALDMWEEDCSIAYISPSMPNAGSVCAVPIDPINVPVSFNMSSIGTGGSTLLDIDLGVVLVAGEAVRVSINSTAPVIFHLYLDNRTGYDVKSLANEVANYAHLIINSSEITSYNQQIRANEGGLYIFELLVSQPSPIATATFDIRPS